MMEDNLTKIRNRNAIRSVKKVEIIHVGTGSDSNEKYTLSKGIYPYASEII